MQAALKYPLQCDVIERTGKAIYSHLAFDKGEEVAGGRKIGGSLIKGWQVAALHTLKQLHCLMNG